MPNYKELLPVDQPPFPFKKDANGGYPHVALPDGVLSPDIEMQRWYILCLKYVQKSQPEATISSDSGIATITASGVQVILTGMMQNAWFTKFTTVEEQMNKAFGIVPPVAPPVPQVDPNPLPKGPFEEPVGSGKWYRYIIFDIKVACPPPPIAAQPKVDDKTAIRGYMSTELGKQPPKSEETIAFAAGVLDFMSKLK